MRTIKINKGWFFGAGSMYSWTKDGHHIHGVGLAIDKLKDQEEIRVVVDDVKYKLNVDEAREFVKKYDSIKVAKGKKLAVISKSLLEEV